MFSQVLTLEMREGRTEVCQAERCSGEAREAVQVLHGGWGDGFDYCP